MAFTYVTLLETYETAGDLPASGHVTLSPVDQMRNGITVISGPNVANLDNTGSISIRVAATTDPATTPVGVTYKVVESIVGQTVRTYYVSVPHNAGATLQLADLTVIAPDTGAAGFALRNATDYDDCVAPTDGQVMTWDSGTSKFHPETGAGVSGVTSVNGDTGVVTVTTTGIGAQPVDSDLTALAALTPNNDDVIQRKTGAWTTRSPSQIKTDLALVKGDVGLGNVDNTSDTDKPLSSAATSALSGKAAASHTHAVTDLSATGTRDSTTFLRGDNTWAVGTAGVPATIVDAKGDLIVATAADTVARLAVGTTDGQILTADSGATGGVSWGPGGALLAINPQTTSYTPVLGDLGKVIQINSASGTTLTIPPNSSVAFPVTGQIGWRQYGAGQVTVAAGAGVTLRTPSSLTTRAQYSEMWAHQVAANEWLISGDMS